MELLQIPLHEGVPLSGQPLPDLAELARAGGPEIAPAPGSLTAPFRDPRFAKVAAAAGLREADLRRAERSIHPLTPEEVIVLGCLRVVPGLLDPILPAESLMLLHGPRGVGLSQLAVGMAVVVEWEDITDEITIPRFRRAG